MQAPEPRDPGELRLARRTDAASILAIYVPFVRESAVTFEEQVPSLEDFQDRIAAYLDTAPWLVYVDGDRLLGFAHATPFRSRRPAYRWTIEVTVYVDPSAQGRGIATGLYTGLTELLKLQGYRTAIAVVAEPNPASVRFHEGFGFTRAGVLARVGYKLGRWHDVGWWLLPLQPYSSSPAEPTPLPHFLARPEGASAAREALLAALGRRS